MGGAVWCRGSDARGDGASGELVHAVEAAVAGEDDTNLLGATTAPSVLRRDQIWFTEKDSAGATHLYPLTDFHPRKQENLERGYLQGRYGAVPFLGDLSFSDDAES